MNGAAFLLFISLLTAPADEQKLKPDSNDVMTAVIITGAAVTSGLSYTAVKKRNGAKKEAAKKRNL